MSFIQIIELQTHRFDEIEQLRDAWMAETEGQRTLVGSRVVLDRDRTNSYMVIAEFASFEDAMVNSGLPATQRFAEAIAPLLDAPPVFRNLDVVRVE